MNGVTIWAIYVHLKAWDQEHSLGNPTHACLENETKRIIFFAADPMVTSYQLLLWACDCGDEGHSQQPWAKDSFLLKQTSH